MLSPNIQPNLTGRPPIQTHAYLFHEKERLTNARGTIERILLYLAKKRGVLALVFLCATITTLNRSRGHTLERLYSRQFH